MLCCAVLCCVVLCCVVLYCAILCGGYRVALPIFVVVVVVVVVGLPFFRGLVGVGRLRR